jgi:hypothetical protein
LPSEEETEVWCQRSLGGLEFFRAPAAVVLVRVYCFKPGAIRWNPNADLDGNGVVGLSDLDILAQHYRRYWP